MSDIADALLINILGAEWGGDGYDDPKSRLRYYPLRRLSAFVTVLHANLILKSAWVPLPHHAGTCSRDSNSRLLSSSKKFSCRAECWQNSSFEMFPSLLMSYRSM